MAKTCKDCNIEKPLDQFGSVGGKQKHIKRTYCKSCAVVRTSVYRETDIGKLVNNVACAKYYHANKEDYYKNKPLRTHHAAMYRARKLKATPDWLTAFDLEMIKWTYEAAKIAEDHYGEPYHVDHIIPLKGENICGLHVPWNLQVLTAYENISKGNRLP